MLLSREYTEQLKQPERKLLKDVPGLDRDVLIKPLIGLDRVQFYAKAHDAASAHEHEMIAGFVRMAVLVMESVIEEDGNRIYSDDDFNFVTSLDQTTLIHIADEAQKLNGFDTGELEGNS